MNSVILRELESNDIPQLNIWRNDKELIDTLGNNFRYISSDVDQEWYKQYMQNRDKQIRLAIVLAETNQYVGNVNLTDIHSINASAEFSIWIGAKNLRSKGIGTFATKKILEHGFNNLNLNRIYLTVLNENKPAINLYLKTGFNIDGTHRQAIFKNGTFHDLVSMSILKSDFLK